MSQVSKTIPLKRVVWHNEVLHLAVKELADMLDSFAMNDLGKQTLSEDDAFDDQAKLAKAKALTKEIRKAVEHEITACHIVEAEDLTILHAYESV